MAALSGDREIIVVKHLVCAAGQGIYQGVHETFLQQEQYRRLVLGNIFQYIDLDLEKQLSIFFLRDINVPIDSSCETKSG